MKLHKINQKTLTFLFLSTFACLSHSAPEVLAANMQVFNVDNNEKKLLKASDPIKPNSRLEYRVTYTNTSTNALKELKLNVPLPREVTYLGKSLPLNSYASTDGQHFAKTPLTRVLNGKKVLVPLNEYRVLQWQISELKPKQIISVAAQVRVNSAD